MKSSKINLDKDKKINLDKEAIVKLQETQIANTKGGSATVPTGTCQIWSCAQSCTVDTCAVDIQA